MKRPRCSRLAILVCDRRPGRRAAKPKRLNCVNKGGTAYVFKKRPRACAVFGPGGTFGGGVDLKRLEWKGLGHQDRASHRRRVRLPARLLEHRRDREGVSPTHMRLAARLHPPEGEVDVRHQHGRRSPLPAPGLTAPPSRPRLRPPRHPDAPARRRARPGRWHGLSSRRGGARSGAPAAQAGASPHRAREEA